MKSRILKNLSSEIIDIMLPHYLDLEGLSKAQHLVEILQNSYSFVEDPILFDTLYNYVKSHKDGCLSVPLGYVTIFRLKEFEAKTPHDDSVQKKIHELTHLLTLLIKNDRRFMGDLFEIINQLPFLAANDKSKLQTMINITSHSSTSVLDELALHVFIETNKEVLSKNQMQPMFARYLQSLWSLMVLGDGKDIEFMREVISKLFSAFINSMLIQNFHLIDTYQSSIAENSHLCIQNDRLKHFF